MIKVLADENIPLAQELFGQLGQLQVKAGRDIHAHDLLGVDALIVRSVTKVNGDLFRYSQPRFVGSCTIGQDHLDTRYLEREGIAYASAPGCNALSVVQYVISVLARLKRLEPRRYEVGIIGCGNIGRVLLKVLTRLGFSCCYYDPFLTDDDPASVSLDELMKRDIVCMHTPLTTTGPYPSYHMLNAERLAALKPGALLINAGRGAAIDSAALKTHLQTRPALQVALDVWENEPNIDVELMGLVDIATPHIAGYSYEGKINGSLMIYQQLAHHLGIEAKDINNTVEMVKRASLGERVKLPVRSVEEAIFASYDVREDDKKLRDQGVAHFDALRKNYPRRREFSHYALDAIGSSLNEKQKQWLQNLGFAW